MWKFNHQHLLVIFRGINSESVLISLGRGSGKSLSTSVGSFDKVIKYHRRCYHREKH